MRTGTPLSSTPLEASMTITFLPSWNDQAAEAWIKVFRMKNQKKVAAFLDKVDAHDDGLHPIAYQMKQGVRYL